MTAVSIARPGADECNSHFAAYVAEVPPGDLFELLARQQRETAEFLAAIPEDRAGFRYAPGKWSIKEVVGHVCDTERIMAYRLLCLARADTTPLPGFEQDDYVPPAHFDRRTLRDLAAELAAIRSATLALLRGLDAEALARRGIVSGDPMSARALAYIIAGHERRHLRTLQTRYLAG